MKKNKTLTKIFVDLIVLGLLFVGTTALATTTATVAATVTLQNVAVQMSVGGTVTYGTLAVNTTKTTLTGGVNQPQTASNSGNVAEDFNIEGTNSADWTLAGTASADQYVHRFCKTGCGTDSSPTLGTGGNGFTVLSSSGYTALATNVATSGTQSFDLMINMPTSSTHFGSESVDVVVQAVAH